MAASHRWQFKAGFTDIARECARDGLVEPKTLVTAARDAVESDPSFAYEVAMRAIDLLLGGYGYETTTVDVYAAFGALMEAAHNMGVADWAARGVEELLGREPPNYDTVSAKAVRELLERHRKTGGADNGSARGNAQGGERDAG